METISETLLQGRAVIDGFSVLKHSWLIPFKAKAWLDLTARSRRGEHVDSRNLKKHRNDIIRMAAELVLERCELPGEVRDDMADFIETMNVSDQEIKNLKLRGVRAEDIRKLLVDTYLYQVSETRSCSNWKNVIYLSHRAQSLTKEVLLMERKKAIITGAEIGMGRGIAAVLAQEGYDIAFSYYPNTQNVEAAIETTVSMLQERGAQAWYYPADLSQPGAPGQFFEKAVESLGGLDLLVNNAGVNIPLPIQDITEENFDYLISLDLRAYVMMMHHAARYMIDKGIHGCLVNISSSRGERAYANAGIYCGIKACLNHMAEAFALDLSSYGIRVNNVAPGAVRVRTDEELLSMTQGRATDYFWDKEFLKNPELVSDHDFWDMLGPKIPLGRVGLPEDIGKAVAFLASEKASYITGVTLRVDGGLILPGMPEDSSMHANGWK